MCMSGIRNVYVYIKLGRLNVHLNIFNNIVNTLVTILVIIKINAVISIFFYDVHTAPFKYKGLDVDEFSTPYNSVATLQNALKPSVCANF